MARGGLWIEFLKWLSGGRLRERSTWEDKKSPIFVQRGNKVDEEKLAETGYIVIYCDKVGKEDIKEGTW